MLTPADRIPVYPWDKHDLLVKSDGRPYFRSYMPDFITTNNKPVKFFFEKKEELFDYLNDKFKDAHIGTHEKYQAKIITEEYSDGVKLVVMANDMDVFVAGYVYNLN